MSQDLIIALQSVLIFLQMVNTGIATITKNPMVPLLISAGVGGLQYFVTHLSNHSISPEVNTVLTSQQKMRIAESSQKPPVPVVDVDKKK